MLSGNRSYVHTRPLTILGIFDDDVASFLLNVLSNDMQGESIHNYVINAFNFLSINNSSLKKMATDRLVPQLESKIELLRWSAAKALAKIGIYNERIVFLLLTFTRNINSNILADKLLSEVDLTPYLSLIDLIISQENYEYSEFLRVSEIMSLTPSENLLRHFLTTNKNIIYLRLIVERLYYKCSSIYFFENTIILYDNKIKKNLLCSPQDKIILLNGFKEAADLHVGISKDILSCFYNYENFKIKPDKIHSKERSDNYHL